MKRVHMSLSIKLSAALYALGLDPDDVEYDHCPALAMRPVDPATGDTVPPANDPRYIVPRSRADHKAKTFGTSIPLSGDISQIRKLDRVEEKHAAFRQKVLAKTTPADVAPAQRRRACAIPSRPFQKKNPA